MSLAVVSCFIPYNVSWADTAIPGSDYQDHVSAVLDVDFSPTGREFVSGSYDRTVRIFPYNAGHSREIYHGKRMQRIWSVLFSGDSKWVLSASDDFNIRCVSVWVLSYLVLSCLRGFEVLVFAVCG